MAENLKQLLNFGCLSFPKKSFYVGYRISCKQSLKKVLELTNGKWVGPLKYNQLKKHQYAQRLHYEL